MYDSEISPPESDTIIPESDLSADPADTEMLPEDAAAFTAAYPVDEETAQWRRQNLTAEADRESYISGTDPVRALREASGQTLQRIEYSELMLDRLSRQVMGLCSEQESVEEKRVKQVLDKTRMVTSIIRGYQHLFTMHEELIGRVSRLHERDEKAGAAFDRLQAEKAQTGEHPIPATPASPTRPVSTAPDHARENQGNAEQRNQSRKTPRHRKTQKNMQKKAPKKPQKNLQKKNSAQSAGHTARAAAGPAPAPFASSPADAELEVLLDQNPCEGTDVESTDLDNIDLLLARETLPAQARNSLKSLRTALSRTAAIKQAARRHHQKQQP